MLISEIETKLSQIWDSLQGTNKMRACLLNLVVYTYKTKRASYIRTITQKVIERFPSRIIFVTVDKESSKGLLEAKASVMPGAKGEFDIVCDLIEIEADGATEGRIPYLILPHLLPDLPVYFLWAEDPVKENPISLQLDKFATRIIFDSESTDNLPEFSKAILRHKEEAGCDIADLNWARTESWRELLSATFYSKERLKQLGRIQSIQITYNARETEFYCHTKIQAVYLQGWLASQLKWSLKEIRKEGEKLQFIYKDLTVDLIPSVHENLSAGTVISMELMTKQQEHFSFCRSPEHPHQVRMILCTEEKCEIPSNYVFTKSQSGLSLVGEIYHSGTSQHYLSLLNLLTQLQSKWLC